jgi:hypothetical protein
MEQVEKKTRICSLCGRVINYKIVTEDGCDWMGHHRGQESTHTVGYDCSCNHSDWKKMCLNCRFYINGLCTNEETIDSYNKTLNTDFFDVQVVKTIKIKNNTKHCQFWCIKSEIGNQIFKD